MWSNPFYSGKKLKKSPLNGNPRIRAIKADEQDENRRWPEKKHLASEHPELLPKPGSKSRIHSVITALPLLMVLAGFYIYFKGENEQSSGTPIVSELVDRQGEYAGVSSSGSNKHFMWLRDGEKNLGVRITVVQSEQLKSIEKGVMLEVKAAPTVIGSNTLWAYSVKDADGWVLAPTK